MAVVATQKQLGFAQQNLRSRAGRDDVLWCLWAPAQEGLDALDLDEVDLHHALRRCLVTAVHVSFGVTRFVAVGPTADGIILEVLVLVADDPPAIEVFTVRPV